jgi:hypothetical protein
VPRDGPLIPAGGWSEKIQPMALPGRWATIKAPTTMKALKPRNSRSWLPTSCWKVPLATARRSPTTRLTMMTASMDQATQLQRLPTVPPRLLGHPGTALRELGNVVPQHRPEIVTKSALRTVSVSTLRRVWRMLGGWP